MTIETLNKRIEGKQKSIASLEKKIARIEAANATNWEKNPYYYTERDLTCALKDVESEKRALEKYESQLAEEENKANSRNVEVILAFLETWKKNCIAYYKEEKVFYEEAKAEFRQKDKEFTDKFNRRFALGITREELRELELKNRKEREEFRASWTHVTQFFHGDLPWEENLEKDLEIEKNRKYDDIIERTVAITGTITDASNLRVGAKGDLTGFIIGESGKAKVETVGAGGYNQNVILDSGRHGQRFHFRTIIKPLK